MNNEVFNVYLLITPKYIKDKEKSIFRRFI